MTPKTNKKKLQHMQRLTAIGFTLIAVALLLPARALAGPPSPLIPGSDSAGEIARLFYLVLAIAVVVFVLVEGLLIYAVLRYRRREDDEEPEQIHGNATLEILWTIIPAAIMVGLFVLTLNSIQTQNNAPEDAYEIRVIGHQWFWEFQYGDTQLSLTNDLHIPVGKPVKFIITSTDVIHSFWVPQLSGKQDAIPGRNNDIWFTVNQIGIYPGECAEFCGREHYAMLFDTTVVSEADFEAWIFEKLEEQKTVPCPPEPDQEDPTQENPACEPEEVPAFEELPEGTAASGEGVFTAEGCAACHSLDGARLVGPSFQGLGARAEGRSAEESSEQYLIHSILRPCDSVVASFTCVMPPIYGEQLTRQELADLIAFIMEQ
jgi:cytochrome c oxidase subunit II